MNEEPLRCFQDWIKIFKALLFCRNINNFKIARSAGRLNLDLAADFFPIRALPMGEVTEIVFSLISDSYGPTNWYFIFSPLSISSMLT